MGIFTREAELEGILGTFSKTANRLNVFAAKQEAKKAKLAAQMEAMCVEHNTTVANIAQAKASAAKIAEIIASPAA